MSFTVKILIQLSVLCDSWSRYLDELRKCLVDKDKRDEESKNLLGKW